MAKETLFPTTETRVNLRRLDNLLKESDSITSEFGQYLSINLAEKITAKGFILYVRMVIHNLSTGHELLDGRPIESNLVGHENETYITLQKRIPEIVDVIFPKFFAEEVKQTMIKIEKMEE